MKEHESALARRTVVGVFVALCVLASCTGADDGLAVPTVGVAPTEIEAALTPGDEVEPTVVVADPVASSTVTPEPVVVSDDDRIAAVYAAFEADPDPSELIAWDLSDPFVNDAGLVSFRVCGWDGQGVFDQIYDAVYETYTDDDGTITTRRRDVALSAGDCLNTALLTSVFDFIAEVDDYLADTFEAPGSFSVETRSGVLSTSAFVQRYAGGRQSAAAAGLSDLNTSYRTGDLPASASAPIGIRRAQAASGEILELGVCQPMNNDYGEYRGGQLVDDRKPESGVGESSISHYVVVPTGDMRMPWQLEDLADGVWVDCLQTGDWLSFLNAWKPGQVPWSLLQP